MKAIEYVENFNKIYVEGDDRSLFKAINEMFTGIINEGSMIISYKKAIRDSAVIAVIREQNLKWKSIGKKKILKIS